MVVDYRGCRGREVGRCGESEAVSRAEPDPDRVMRADQVLVGRNNTRRSYNMRMRQKRHIEDPLPVEGDKLVCLRNNRKKGLFNGGLWRGKKRLQSELQNLNHPTSTAIRLRSKGAKGLLPPHSFCGAA